jgi:hypothetical protein
MVTGYTPLMRPNKKGALRLLGSFVCFGLVFGAWCR